MVVSLVLWAMTCSSRDSMDRMRAKQLFQMLLIKVYAAAVSPPLKVKRVASEQWATVQLPASLLLDGAVLWPRAQQAKASFREAWDRMRVRSEKKIRVETTFDQPSLPDFIFFAMDRDNQRFGRLCEPIAKSVVTQVADFLDRHVFQAGSQSELNASVHFKTRKREAAHNRQQVCEAALAMWSGQKEGASEKAARFRSYRNFGARTTPRQLDWLRKCASQRRQWRRCSPTVAFSTMSPTSAKWLLRLACDY